MKVSVVIPVYNEEKVIGECLESLAKQTHENLEIIVVDDGSIDSSKVKIQNAKLQFKIQSLKTLSQDHKGAGSARNFGVKHASGEILVFVDADMTFDREFINQLIKPIIQGKAVGTFSKDEYLANKGNIWARCWNINRGFPPHKMHADNHPDTQKVFRAIKKEDFIKVGGFDEKAGYTDDWSLSEKLGVVALAAPGAIFYHRNPETLREVFIQSKWMSKRKYKLGSIGYLVSLVRVSFPVSIVVGIYKSIAYCLAPFALFKVVSDFGQFLGILEFWLFGDFKK